MLAGEPVGEVHADPALAVLGDVGDLDVAAQADRGLVLEVGAQQVLELGLVEHVGLRVPVPAVVAGAVEDGEDPVVAVDQLQAAGGPGHRGELLGDAEPGQDPVDLVVEVHGARLGRNAIPAVEDEAFDAVLPEKGGGGDPNGAGANDDDGDRIGAAARRGVHSMLPITGG